MDSTPSTRALLALLGGGLLLGLGIGAVVFFGLPALDAPDAASEISNTPAPIAGAPAPDFTLTNIKGQPVRLSSFAGRPVLINYWATWCGPCLDEMPAIEAAFQRHKAEGLVVLAVDADESLSEVTDFVTSLELTFEILMDPGLTVTDTYRVLAYPSSFFIGRDGRVAALQIGTMSEAQLAENLAKILPR